ncbi:PREDICTED: probable helicase senataxin [Dufourea novaeangliae]|uniref:Putative helicase senataxin n=1 Tax=Dufourea novaeangliae TaxID=178035 RepID=A0A154PT62_DUFNO|nr:PREDICTED: probable helicase senataxin [Dufourea novaeangliae]KZC15053.1 putative helicase senataxin [Dufourea novaeangliae]
MDANDHCQFVLERININDTIILNKPYHTYTCGRAKDNEIVCLGLTVSRRHCMFFHGKNEIYVTDLKSANGLFINGVAQEPYQTTKLNHNDIIGVGCPDLNAKEHSMFVYKLHIIEFQKSRTVDSNHNASALSETVLNHTNASKKCTADDKSDPILKRKRDMRNCDTKVVPNKIPKLEDNSKVRLEESLNEDSKVIDDNDIEIVHVSLNNSILEQSSSNCCTSAKTTRLSNHSIASKHTDCDMLDVNNSVKNKKKCDLSKDCKIQFNEFLCPKNSKSLVSSNANDSDREEKDAAIDCKHLERSSKNTVQNVQKCMENSLLNNKNKENMVNNPNCRNIQSDNKMESSNAKMSSTENINSDSRASLKNDVETSGNSNTKQLNVEQSMVENNTGKTLSSLPTNFVHTGDSVIKMEEELQLTDTDEDAIWNSMGGIPMPLVSPIKLKQVQQEPKTKFSEEDVINLSDSEDDVFPCSQLFDIGFGMNTSIKQEVKEETADMENERFSMLGDEDLVISLSDSEDEDDNWLRRLSRSQILNEDKIKTETEHQNKQEENMDVAIVDIENPISTSNKSVDKSESSTKERVQEEKRKQTEKFVNEEEEEQREASLQDARNTIEMYSLSVSIERMNVRSIDRSANSMELSSDSPVTSKKFYESLKTKDSSFKKQEIENRDTYPSGVAETMKTSRRKSLEKRVPQIEPQHLPSRRRSASTNRTKEVSEKSTKQRLTANEKKELKEKAKMEEYERAKEQKNRKVLNKWAADCLPSNKKKTSTPLTKEDKKALAQDRKLKLKKIAMEKKRSSLDNTQEKKRIASKPKAKVSVKSRNDLLVEDTISLSKSEETKEKLRPSNRSTTTNNTLPIPKLDGTTSKVASKEFATRAPNLSSLAGLGKIPKKSNATKFTITTTNPDALENVSLAKRLKEPTNIGTKKAEVKNKSNTQSTLSSGNRSALSSASSVAKSPRKKPKKRVSFSANIETVREYEIDESNVMKKLAGKDAPIPNKSNDVVTTNEKTNEFLLRIFAWKPIWLEEQEHFKTTPPVVRDDELHVMLTRYKSYEEYCRVLTPLLMLETWYRITKDFLNIDQRCRRPTQMCSIIANSIHTSMVSPNVCFTTLMLEVLATKEDVQRKANPQYGNLVFFEYVRNQEKGQTFHKVFAYVDSVHETILTPWTHYNKDLAHYVNKPYALLTYTMLTKPLQPNILVNRVQRLRSVTRLRPILRLVQGLQNFPKSPLMSMILSPKIEQYYLPSISTTQQLITKDKLNQKQLEAVCKVTDVIVQKQAKLCFIQGPPGTGKSTVIVNIVMQVLYGNNRYASSGGALKILVCAPSNAAIDAITMRLLQIRSSMAQKRFKMVRIGQSEVMHPVVKEISVTELAKRDMKQVTSTSINTPLESVEQEKSLLESKINALKCKLANTQNMDEIYNRNIRMKLADLATKYELLKNRTPLNEMNPKEYKRMLRSGENRILSHADIITCTLSSCYDKLMKSLFATNNTGISVCIVDEAAQSCEAETLIPLMLGVNTLVLVGDPNQLPATTLSPQAKKLGWGQSIFSRVQNAFELHPNNPIIMLDTQYRMQHDICSWPNKFFYAGKLKTNIPRTVEFPFHSYRILHLNTSQNDDNYSNTDEAQFIANMIFSMLTYTNLDNWERISFGILTPYNNQKFIIHKKIIDRMLTLPEKLRRKMKFEVNTVDGFQGQERDVIIMSCVRSLKIGFLSDKQRLCVALTRAKYSLIICGNFSVFNKDQVWNSLLSNARDRRVYFNVNARILPHEIKQHVVKRPTC